MKRRESSGRYGARAAKVSFAMLAALICYQAFMAVYPSADFYLEEMRAVTARQPPAEAKVIAKDASYPDFHGDYCSFSRIRLSEGSYRRLLSELKVDKRFASGPHGEISRGGMAANSLRPARIVNAFVRADLDLEHRYEIAFLGSGSDIEVVICVT